MTDEMEVEWVEMLTNLGACPEAITWARGYPDLAAAWAVCERGDWMLWLAGKLSGPPDNPSRKRLVLAACECARLVLVHVPAGEDRPRIAIETAERWARGEAGVTLADVRAAYADAHVAAYAYAAAAHAAYAAIYAAYATTAADAADATRTRMFPTCADIVRRHYPTPPIKEVANG